MVAFSFDFKPSQAVLISDLEKQPLTCLSSCSDTGDSQVYYKKQKNFWDKNSDKSSEADMQPRNLVDLFGSTIWFFLKKGGGGRRKKRKRKGLKQNLEKERGLLGSI